MRNGIRFTCSAQLSSALLCSALRLRKLTVFLSKTRPFDIPGGFPVELPEVELPINLGFGGAYAYRFLPDIFPSKSIYKILENLVSSFLVLRYISNQVMDLL